MKAQALLMTALVLVGCEAEKSDTSVTLPSGCADEFSFEVDESITAEALQWLLNSVDGEMADISCEMVCARHEGDIVEVSACAYSLDFETVPEDFSEWDGDTAVGTIQCSGMAQEGCD